MDTNSYISAQSIDTTEKFCTVTGDPEQNKCSMGFRHLGLRTRKMFNVFCTVDPEQNK